MKQFDSVGEVELVVRVQVLKGGVPGGAMLTGSGKGNKACALLIKISGGVYSVTIVNSNIVSVGSCVVEITLVGLLFVPEAVLNNMNSIVCIDTRIGIFYTPYNI